MPNTKAEITITQAGIVGITLHMKPGLHGLRNILDGIRRSAWAFEALDAAVRLGCRQGVRTQNVSHEKER